MKKILMIAAAALTLAACGQKSDQQTEGTPIGRQQITLTSDRLTPEALWALGRIGSVAVDEEHHRLAYTVTYYSVEQNKSNAELYLQNLDEAGRPQGDAVQLTNDNYYEGEPAWMQDGRLAYLSSEGGKAEVWAMRIDSTGACASKEVIASMDEDIEGFILSPDEKKILLISQVKTVPTTADKYPDLPKASGRVVTDLMYKHWDEWTETAPHPFVADFDGSKASNIKDLLEGEPYECPMKPFGGTEQLCWSPDSRYIAYTCRKKTGIKYACSTNSDIYLYDTQTGETQNLSEGMMGYDTNPQFSPDGKKIAWQSMERDGYESDQNRLMVLDGETRELNFVSEALETSVEEYFWADDSTLVFTACWHALVHIYSTDLQGNIKELSDGQYDFSLCGKMGNQVICKRHSMREPDEIYAQSMSDKSIMRISHENDYILSQIEMGQVEARWQETTDGKQMLTWIIYPPHFDKTKKYPTLLYCEGGPQSPVSQFWSYRWNFMMMAANDYIIVAPNRRGLPGFGNDWNEQISGDYGGQCMKDYLVAIDEFTASMPFVDRAHLGCVGASFGGYSVYWLAGHHEGRFKAFIAHDGIFNMEMQYLETEEKWFANWDMGGAYWDKQNAVAQRTFQNSPHLFVDKWDTPILCIHGEKDYRILANQGMAAFDAAKMRGVEAELLIFPDENHWVLKPQNGVLWQRTFYEWLDKWLKVND